jgi:hypothetical protein
MKNWIKLIRDAALFIQTPLPGLLTSTAPVENTPASLLRRASQAIKENKLAIVCSNIEMAAAYVALFQQVTSRHLHSVPFALLSCLQGYLDVKENTEFREAIMRSVYHPCFTHQPRTDFA